MREKIFAVINNLDGLTTQERMVLNQMGCEVGSVCNVKDVIVNGDSYEAVCDVYTAEITFDSNNVKLYRTYGDDVKLYDPLKDKELTKPKQQGE